MVLKIKTESKKGLPGYTMSVRERLPHPCHVSNMHSSQFCRFPKLLIEYLRSIGSTGKKSV